MDRLNLLNEEKVLFVRQYVGLLDVIEEALGHIFLSLEELRLEDADRLWEDIMLAFGHIRESNKVLAEHFAESPGILLQFYSFEDVWKKTHFLQNSDFSLWEAVIGETIYPAFSEWSREINKQFRPYYIN